jgi:hypothetical protein
LNPSTVKKKKIERRLRKRTKIFNIWFQHIFWVFILFLKFTPFLLSIIFTKHWSHI